MSIAFWCIPLCLHLARCTFVLHHLYLLRTLPFESQLYAPVFASPSLLAAHTVLAAHTTFSRCCPLFLHSATLFICGGIENCWLFKICLWLRYNSSFIQFLTCCNFPCIIKILYVCRHPLSSHHCSIAFRLLCTFSCAHRFPWTLQLLMSTTGGGRWKDAPIIRKCYACLRAPFFHYLHMLLLRTRLLELQTPVSYAPALFASNLFSFPSTATFPLTIPLCYQRFFFTSSVICIVSFITTWFSLFRRHFYSPLLSKKWPVRHCLYRGRCVCSLHQPSSGEPALQLSALTHLTPSFTSCRRCPGDQRKSCGSFACNLLLRIQSPSFHPLFDTMCLLVLYLALLGPYLTSSTSPRLVLHG